MYCGIRFATWDIGCQSMAQSSPVRSRDWWKNGIYLTEKAWEITNNLKFFPVGVLDLCFRVLTSLLEGQNTGHERGVCYRTVGSAGSISPTVWHTDPFLRFSVRAHPVSTWSPFLPRHSSASTTLLSSCPLSFVLWPFSSLGANQPKQLQVCCNRVEIPPACPQVSPCLWCWSVASLCLQRAVRGPEFL